MSSADSGRYQSRLFNFIHQRSRQVTEQCDRALRQLQFATSGVAAVLLSPFYWLFESTRSVAFRPAQPSSSPQIPASGFNVAPSTPPAADTPIRQALDYAVALPLETTATIPTNPFAFFMPLRFLNQQKSKGQSYLPPSTLSTRTPHLPKHKLPVVRGIATQLENRTLVLVTAENEILDILTPQQQEKLQERIIGEVAEYWQYQRLTYQLAARLELNADIANQAKQRLERSPFQDWKEGRGLSLPTINPNPNHAWVFVDRIVAELESKCLVPVSTAITSLSLANIRQRGWELVQRRHQLDTSAVGDGSAAMSPDGTATRAFKLQALIWGAIDYFFGNRGRNFLQPTSSTAISGKGGVAYSLAGVPGLQFNPLPPTNSQSQEKSLPQTQANKLLGDRASSSSQTEVEDPWLTLSDLFGESVEASEPETAQQPELSKSKTIRPRTEKKIALPTNQASGKALRRLFGRLQQFLPLSQQSSGLEERQKPATGKVQRHGDSSRGAAAFHQTSPSVANSIGGGKMGVSSSPQSQNPPLEPAPDWIEISATSMGYVKHPLEQLLEWLDRAMLWVEEVLLRVWQRLRLLLNN